MKHIFFTAFLLLTFLHVSAQNVETKIKAVTVYKNGALVERTGKLNLPNGNTTLYLNNLSEELDPNTLRIGLFHLSVIKPKLKKRAKICRLFWRKMSAS